MMRILTGAMVVSAALALSACSSGPFGRSDAQPRAQAQSSGGGGLFGGRSRPDESGIGVNSFLWRATLDTLNFMPLVSADPFGGIIITDWHSQEGRPGERFKATVYILDTRLRADGIKVALFRQLRNANGEWQDASVDPDTGVQLENAILTRARQLRLATIEGGRS